MGVGWIYSGQDVVAYEDVPTAETCCSLCSQHETCALDMVGGGCASGPLLLAQGHSGPSCASRSVHRRKAHVGALSMRHAACRGGPLLSPLEFVDRGRTKTQHRS